LPIETDAALLHRLEAGNGTQGRGLAAAAGAEQAGDAAFFHAQAEFTKDQRAIVAAGDLVDCQQGAHGDPDCAALSPARKAETPAAPSGRADGCRPRPTRPSP